MTSSSLEDARRRTRLPERATRWPVDQGVAEGAGAVAAERAGRPGARPGRRSSQAGQVGEQDRDDSAGDERRRGRQQRAGVATACGGGPVAEQGGVDAARRAEHLARRPARRPARGAGGTRVELPCSLAVEAGDDRREPARRGPAAARAARRG